MMFGLLLHLVLPRLPAEPMPLQRWLSTYNQANGTKWSASPKFRDEVVVVYGSPDAEGVRSGLAKLMRARWKQDVLETASDADAVEEGDALSQAERIKQALLKKLRDPSAKQVEPFPGNRPFEANFIDIRPELIQIAERLPARWFANLAFTRSRTIDLNSEPPMEPVSKGLEPVLDRLIAKWNIAYGKRKAEIDPFHRNGDKVLSRTLTRSTAWLRVTIEGNFMGYSIELKLATKEGEVLAMEEYEIAGKETTAPLPRWAITSDYAKTLPFGRRLEDFRVYWSAYRRWFQSRGGSREEPKAPLGMKAEMAACTVNDPVTWTFMDLIQHEPALDGRPVFALVPDEVLKLTYRAWYEDEVDREQKQLSIADLMRLWNGYILNWTRSDEATFIRPTNPALTRQRRLKRDQLEPLLKCYLTGKFASLDSMLGLQNLREAEVLATVLGSATPIAFFNGRLLPLARLRGEFRGRLEDFPTWIREVVTFYGPTKKDPLFPDETIFSSRARGARQWIATIKPYRWPPDTRVSIKVWKADRYGSESPPPDPKDNSTSVWLDCDLVAPDGASTKIERYFEFAREPGLTPYPPSFFPDR